jgi:hypothetical protein
MLLIIEGEDATANAADRRTRRIVDYCAVDRHVGGGDAQYLDALRGVVGQHNPLGWLSRDNGRGQGRCGA